MWFFNYLLEPCYKKSSDFFPPFLDIISKKKIVEFCKLENSIYFKKINSVRFLHGQKKHTAPKTAQINFLFLNFMMLPH